MLNVPVCTYQFINRESHQRLATIYLRSARDRTISAECTNSVAGRLPTLIMCRYFGQNTHTKKVNLNWIVNDNNLEGSNDKKEEPAHRKSSVCVRHARQSVYYVTKYLKWRNTPSYTVV